MHVSIEATTGLERRMTIGVPAAEVESAVEARLQEAAKTVRINGFRKGKIPLKVIKNRFGAGVRQEVLGDIMSRSYYTALNEQKIKPAGQPRIEPKVMDEGKDIEFVAVFEIYPDVTLSDFSKIKVEKLVANVSDKDIDTMIETLRQQRQTWDEVKRQAKDGDMLNIDFEGTIDGEAFQGGSATNNNLVLGSGRMIAGFETGLLKSKAGKKITLDLAFPNDYRSQELAGKAVVFNVKVNKVSEAKLPELDDEFFTAFGVEEGGEEGFRKEVAANMERELRKASKTRLKTALMDELLAHNSIDIPSALAGAEVNVLRQQALQQFGDAAKNLDPSLLPDELFSEQAEKRVKLGLLLGEVIKQQGLRADPAKVREAVEDIASTYETPEEVINWYYSNKDQLDTIESAVLEDQVFDIVAEKAKVSERKVSYEELTRPKQASEEGDVKTDKPTDKPTKKPAKKKPAKKKGADEAVGAGTDK
jgi:trigger factor